MHRGLRRGVYLLLVASRRSGRDFGQCRSFSRRLCSHASAQSHVPCSPCGAGARVLWTGNRFAGVENKERPDDGTRRLWVQGGHRNSGGGCSQLSTSVRWPTRVPALPCPADVVWGVRIVGGRCHRHAHTRTAGCDGGAGVAGARVGVCPARTWAARSSVDRRAAAGGDMRPRACRTMCARRGAALAPAACKGTPADAAAADGSWGRGGRGGAPVCVTPTVGRGLPTAARPTVRRGRAAAGQGRKSLETWRGCTWRAGRGWRRASLRPSSPPHIFTPLTHAQVLGIGTAERCWCLPE